MTNTGGTPAGWYYAQGDPEGTQRYWDGGQWIGEPQQVPQAQPQPEPQQPAGFAAPEGGQSAVAPPVYGAPAGSPPPGYQGFAPAAPVGNYAEWGTRAVALLIDWGIGLAISLAGLVLVLIGFALADALGILMVIVLVAASLAYSIWNFCVRQGTTGQTIGKEKQGIKLVRDDTGQPVGTGMAFVRYLLAGVIGGFCGIYTILDYLWPLWDVDKKRLTDKMVTMSVVTV